MSKQNTKSISLRTSEYYHDALKIEAEKRERSINYLINEAIALYVKSLEINNEKTN